MEKKASAEKAVPEPAAVLLLVVGAGALLLLHRVSRRGWRPHYPLARLRGVSLVP